MSIMKKEGVWGVFEEDADLISLPEYRQMQNSRRKRFIIN